MAPQAGDAITGGIGRQGAPSMQVGPSMKAAPSMQVFNGAAPGLGFIQGIVCVLHRVAIIAAGHRETRQEEYYHSNIISSIWKS